MTFTTRVKCYLGALVAWHVGWFFPIHQWWTGYHWQWAETGGLHHETLTFLCWAVSLALFLAGRLTDERSP